MAVVNFKLGQPVLYKMLNNRFNESGVTYRIYVLNSAKQTISGAFVTCAFNDAATDGVYAYVDLEQSRYVVIPQDTTIGYIAVQEESPGSRLYISEEPITEKTYTKNGTYTISNLTIKLGG